MSALFCWAANHKLMLMTVVEGELGGWGLAQRSGVACVVRGCKEGAGGGLTVGMASQHQSVRMSLAGEVHSRLTEMTTAAAATAAAAAAAPAAVAVGTVLVQCAFRGVCVRL